MDLKISREKAPEIKLKKEAEISIHKKSLISIKAEEKILFRGKRKSESFGNMKQGKAASVGGTGKKDSTGEKRRTSADKALKKGSQVLRGKGQVTGNSSSSPPGRGNPLPGEVPVEMMQKAGIVSNKDAKMRFQKKKKRSSVEALKKSGRETVFAKGVQKGGKAVLTQMEGGEEVNDTLFILDTAGEPARRMAEERKYAQAAKRLKAKYAGHTMNGKQLQKDLSQKKRSISEKQKKQAIRQRKMQYVINKLTGSENQDSIVKVAKDILRMKASAVMVKIVKYLGALLAPLFGTLFMAAFPVVLIVLLLYCSPLGAFMQNPSDTTPSIQEVLSGYYMEFNQKVSESVGDDGAVSYLHEKDGNYVSNYMDTLMVYMVQYGTGDLGVVMDDTHKRYLKEVFDEMNQFENTSVTSTIQAGESLGNVVTSAYCSCSICCGAWSGGPTASGVMPRANHTLAVDADNPFVPMGTKIIMNGTEYVVEDTGAFDQYGVQFDIYFDDHGEATSWGHQTLEAFLADGDENTVVVTRRGGYVKNLNFEDYIALGKLTGEEEKLLREVMSEEFRAEIPSFGVGSDVANLALTKVGCQYSQEHRYEEGYYDCSSLVQRCYAEFGINLPATASTQGKYIVDHGLEVTADMLEPGDLIFYSYENNGQFRNISHVAIYIGNGRMVHAANTARGVVNDPFSPSNIGLYGRPSMGK